MTFTDPIGDMFSRIRNGQMRSLNSVEIPSSNFRKNILEILKVEGYIKDYYIEKTENNKTSLKVSLKYYEGYPVIKEIKRIKLVKKFQKKRAALKKIINNRKLELSERFDAQLKLNKLPKNSAKIRIRNRCEVSGRPHGVYRKLKISRIALRDMASSGKIPGITKSSW